MESGDTAVGTSEDQGPLIETDGTNDALVTTSGMISQGYAIDVYGMQGPYATNGISPSASTSSAPTASSTRHSKRHNQEPAPEPTLMPSLPAWTRSPSPTVKPSSWWWGPWH